MNRVSLNRVVWSSVLALVAAGALAQAPTMSATVRYQARLRPNHGNVYIVSVPHVGGIPDCANTALSRNKCVATGQAGDGIVNVDDLICSVWGGGDPARRFGAFCFSHFDTQDCMYEPRCASNSAIAGVIFSGPVYELDRTVSYYLAMFGSETMPQDFTTTWVDQCDPPLQPMTVSGPTCGLPVRFLPLPYATDVEDADEVLCGQRGVDWFDVDMDGDPDECPGGLFDGVNGMSVMQFDNSTYQWSIRGVLRPAFSSRPYFFGPHIDFNAGDGVMISISSEQLPRVWAPATTCAGAQ